MKVGLVFLGKWMLNEGIRGGVGAVLFHLLIYRNNLRFIADLFFPKITTDFFTDR